MSRLRERFFDATGLTLEELSHFGEEFCQLQRDIPFFIGDLARYAEARWPDTWQQAFPSWASPGMIDRHKGVAKAYPKEEDRAHEAPYTQYMQVSGKPDRKQLLEEMISKGQTSDESRKATPETKRSRWCLAIDTNYWLHRFWFSGAGVEAAAGVSSWIQRLVERLKEKGLTDVVCCFDSKSSFRKELTADWEDKYKDRPAKEPELIQQIQLVSELLSTAGFMCVKQSGFESDDLLASYAIQFDGRVTILSQDKDMKQCLSEKCNMLTNVEWTEDPTSGEMLPDYKWLSAKQHTDATGLCPAQWADYQAIWGDPVDGIKGAPGIGEKGARDLILEFESLDAVLEAARADDGRIKPKKREALIQLAKRLDVVRQLVTLRNDLEISMDTRV